MRKARRDTCAHCKHHVSNHRYDPALDRVGPQACSVPGCNGPTGVAITPARKSICYACADEQERARMLHERVIVGYLASDGLSITTWSGGALARVLSTHTQRVGFGRNTRRTYWRAVDANGRHWYGCGAGRGMVTTMRARKVDRLPTTSTRGRCGSEYAGDTCDGPGYHP